MTLVRSPWAVTRSRLSCPNTPKFVVHRFQIDSFRVELAANPFQGFFVPLMVGVRDRFHEVRLPPGTARVFWRARPLARHADGILHSLFGRESFLHDQLMKPVIPKVVLVIEPRSAVPWRKYVAQLGFAGILYVLVSPHSQVHV